MSEEEAIIPANGLLLSVPMTSVRANPVALRDVDKSAESYKGLVESIGIKGFQGAITVRENTDQESGESFYEVIDGLHRFTGAKDVGLEMINVNVMPASEAQALEMQLMANHHRVETKNAQYASHLKRMLAMDQTMTEADLASKLGVSPTFIAQRLQLNKIQNEEIRKLIDVGDITLTNAVMLAKLPEDEQADWVDRAVTQNVEEFGAAVNDRVKEVREERRKGRLADKPEFTPQPHLRKMAEIRNELEQGEAAGTLCEGLAGPEDGFAMALNYVLNLDPQSVEIQKAKWEQREKEREASRKKRAAEKADKAEAKAKDAMERAQKAKEEAIASGAESAEG